MTRFAARYPWYAVIALVIVYIFAMIDRQIMPLVIGDLKREFHLDDFRAGLLMGPAFGIFYILGGPLFGMAVDRFARKRVLAIGLTTWSLAASACGLAGSYTQLFAARMLVGAGEASIAPTAYSLISDIFPRQRIASALSIFAIGGTVGGGLSLLIGGLILHALDGGNIVLPLVGAVSGWRAVLIVTGLPGLLLLLLVATLHDPRRRPDAGLPDGMPRPQLRAFLRARKMVLACHFATFCATGMVAYSLAAWMPQYVVRTFGWPSSRAGIVLGTIGIVTSIVSHVSTGFLVDHLFARGMRDAPLRVYRAMLTVALPVMVLAFTFSSPVALLCAAAALHLLVVPFTGLAASALQLVTPRSLRGVMSGLFLAVLGVMGLSVGPSLVGFVTTYVVRDEARLGLSIGLVGTSGLVIAIGLLSLGLRPFREAIAATDSTERDLHSQHGMGDA